MSSINARKPPLGALHVIMKPPRGARGRSQQDSGVFALPSVNAVPTVLGWAMAPKTLSEDGDPLDAVVIDAERTVPGEALQAEILAGLIVQLAERDQHAPERNQRLVLVLSMARDASALSDVLRQQVRDFVVVSGEAAGKRVSIESWEDASYASDAVLRATAAFQLKRA